MLTACLKRFDLRRREPRVFGQGDDPLLLVAHALVMPDLRRRQAFFSVACTPSLTLRVERRVETDVCPAMFNRPPVEVFCFGQGRAQAGDAIRNLIPDELPRARAL